MVSKNVLMYWIKEIQDRTLYFLNIRPGIDTRSIRPFIKDTDDWNGITVLNPTGEVEFTGHCHNGFRLILYNNPPSQRSARGHCNVDLILVSQLDQILDLTLPTTFTVFYISCDLDLAIIILDAVGKQNQQSLWFGSVMVGTNQMVIQFNKGLLDPLLRYPHQSSHQDHKGEKHLRDHSSQLVGEEDIPPP